MFDRRAYARNHYKQNREKYKISARNSNRTVRERNKTIISESKNKPCADCGIQYPPFVMDFDHTRDKSFGIAEQKGKKASVVRLLEEIDKCDVVCANCHRLRTFKRSVLGKSVKPPVFETSA